MTFFCDIKQQVTYLIEDENATELPVGVLLDKLSEQYSIPRDGMRVFIDKTFLKEDKSLKEQGYIEEDKVIQFYSPHTIYSEPDNQLTFPPTSLGYQL